MRRAIGPLVLVRDGAWGRLTEAADARFPLETGGILMGRVDGADCIIVSAVVGPGPGATHEPTRFVPDYDFQEQAVADVYLASRGAQTYLGDWHTHPGAEGAHLSAADRQVLRAIATSPEARAPRPLALVLCGGPGDWRPAAWLGEIRPVLGWRPLRIRPLRIRIVD